MLPFFMIYDIMWTSDYMENLFYYQTKIGRIGICSDHIGITRLLFEEPKDETKFEIIETDLSRKAFHELEEYFSKKRKEFTVPLHVKGTIFQKQVFQELMNIPYGKTTTYQQIAKNIGNPKAYRAVGMANHINPIPIFIPCHRVISKDGKLTGYALGLDKKERLLLLEQEK